MASKFNQIQFPLNSSPAQQPTKAQGQNRHLPIKPKTPPKIVELGFPVRLLIQKAPDHHFWLRPQTLLAKSHALHTLRIRRTKKKWEFIHLLSKDPTATGAPSNSRAILRLQPPPLSSCSASSFKPPLLPIPLVEFSLPSPSSHLPPLFSRSPFIIILLYFFCVGICFYFEG